MKKLLGVLMLVWVTNLFATTNDDVAPETQLKTLLDEFTSFSAEFKQRVTDALGEELQNAEGKLYLQRPNLLHWQSLPPNELTLIADGETVWYVDPFAEQVIAMDQNQSAADHPIMLLADTQAEQWDQYAVTRLDGDAYLLTSNSDQSDVISMKVGFIDRQLAYIEILDRMEQRNSLAFSETLSNLPLSKDLYRFDVPAEFDLDDQRGQ